MATEIDSLPSPPGLPAELASDRERDSLASCQVDVRMDAGQVGSPTVVQQMVGGMGELPQASIGAAEVSIKMLMSSKVSVPRVVEDISLQY